MKLFAIVKMYTANGVEKLALRKQDFLCDACYHVCQEEASSKSCGNLIFIIPKKNVSRNLSVTY